MTPKEKARELFEKFFAKIDHIDLYWDSDEEAKECALIAVEEILNMDLDRQVDIDYWLSVKEELNNI